MMGIITGDEAKAQAPTATYDLITPSGFEPSSASANDARDAIFTITLSNLNMDQRDAAQRRVFFGLTTGTQNNTPGYGQLDSIIPPDSLARNNNSETDFIFILEYMLADGNTAEEAFARGSGTYNSNEVVKAEPNAQGEEVYTFRIIPQHDTAEEGVEYVAFGYRVAFSGLDNSHWLTGIVNGSEGAPIATITEPPPVVELATSFTNLPTNGNQATFTVALRNIPTIVDGTAAERMFLLIGIAGTSADNVATLSDDAGVETDDYTITHSISDALFVGVTPKRNDPARPAVMRLDIPVSRFEANDGGSGDARGEETVVFTIAAKDAATVGENVTISIFGISIRGAGANLPELIAVADENIPDKTLTFDITQSFVTATLHAMGTVVTEEVEAHEAQFIATLAGMPDPGAGNFILVYYDVDFATPQGTNIFSSSRRIFASNSDGVLRITVSNTANTIFTVSGQGQVVINRSQVTNSVNNTVAVEFRLHAPNDDGNTSDDVLTLKITCITAGPIPDNFNSTFCPPNVDGGDTRILGPDGNIAASSAITRASVIVNDDDAAAPAAILDITDDSLAEQTANTDENGAEAVLTLALTGLPTTGADDIKILYTVTLNNSSGNNISNIDIGSDRSRRTRLLTFGTQGPIINSNNGKGINTLHRDDPNPNDGRDNDHIDDQGRATARFVFQMHNDDGNADDERITLTINCIARYSGNERGADGCNEAGDGNILVAGDEVRGVHPAQIIAADDESAAVLSIADGTLTEEAASGTGGYEARFRLALTDLPITGADNLSVFYTLSGFAGEIDSNENTNGTHEVRLHISGAGEIDIRGGSEAPGRTTLDRADHINAQGRATVEFAIALFKDDGNKINETISLTINCIARYRTGTGTGGCAAARAADAANIITSRSGVRGTHPAHITANDNDSTAAVLSITDGTLTEQAPLGSRGRSALFTLLLTDLPTIGDNNLSVYYTLSGFAGEISSGTGEEVHLRIEGAAGPNVIASGARKGQGRLDLNQNMHISDGKANARFTLELPNNDGNRNNERITLTINCIARYRLQAGAMGCTEARADDPARILVARADVEGAHPAGITVTDTGNSGGIPAAVLKATDWHLGERRNNSGQGFQTGKFLLTFSGMPTASNTDPIYVHYDFDDFIPENINPSGANANGQGHVTLRSNVSNLEFTVRENRDDGNTVNDPLILEIDCIGRSNNLNTCLSSPIIAGPGIPGNRTRIVVADMSSSIIDNDNVGDFAGGSKLKNAAVISIANDNGVLIEQGGGEVTFNLDLIGVTRGNEGGGGGGYTLYYTVSGFAGQISGDTTEEVRVQSRKTLRNSIQPSGEGNLRITTINPDSNRRADYRRSYNKEFRGNITGTQLIFSLPNDDGNTNDEILTLTLNCVKTVDNSNQHGNEACATGRTISDDRVNNHQTAHVVVVDDDNKEASALLSITDDTLTERPDPGDDEGRRAVFTLAMSSLPATGADDLSVFYTVSGFAGQIRADAGREVLLQIAGAEGPNILPDGQGRLNLNRNEHINNGNANVRFTLELPNDDGNTVDEHITLSINCAARHRSGEGAAGCTSANADNIVFDEFAVGSAGITVTDTEIPSLLLSAPLLIPNATFMNIAPTVPDSGNVTGPNTSGHYSGDNAAVRLNLQDVPIDHGDAVISYTVNNDNLNTRYRLQVGGDANIPGNSFTDASGSFTISRRQIENRLAGSLGGGRVPHVIIRLYPTISDTAILDSDTEVPIRINSIRYTRGTGAFDDDSIVHPDAVDGNPYTLTIVNAIDNILSARSIPENQGFSFFLTLDQPLPADGTVEYQILALAGADPAIQAHDVNGNLGTASINANPVSAGAREITITVDIRDDNRVEHTERAEIRVTRIHWGSGSGSFTPRANSLTSFTITDNDGVLILFDDEHPHVRDNAGTLDVGITVFPDLSPDTHTEMILDRDVSAIFAFENRSADSGSDYNISVDSFTVDAEPDVSRAAISLAPRRVTIENDEDNTNEVFVLVIQSNNSSVNRGRSNTSTITIVPNTEAGYDSTAGITVNQEDTTAAMRTLTLFHAPYSPATVSFILTGGTAGGSDPDIDIDARVGDEDIALVIDDPGGRTGKLIIPAVGMQTTPARLIRSILTITGRHDADSDDENIAFRITGIEFADAGTVTDIPALTALTITATDAARGPDAVTAVSIDRSGGGPATNVIPEDENIVVTVTMNRALPEAGSVEYTIDPGQTNPIADHDISGGLTGSAPAPADTLMFTFTVDVADDNRIDSAEQEQGAVTISSVRWRDTSASFSANNEANFTITDNDRVRMSLSDAAPRVRDNAPVLNISTHIVPLPSPETNPPGVIVERTISADFATAAGSATADSDYVEHRESYSYFGAGTGMVEASFGSILYAIQIEDDSDNTEETFTLTLSSSNSAVDIATPNEVTATIVPNTTGHYGSAGTTIALTEDDRTPVERTLTLGHAPISNATVSFGLTGGTAAAQNTPDLHALVFTVGGGATRLVIDEGGMGGSFIIPANNSEVTLNFEADTDFYGDDETITFSITSITFADDGNVTDVTNSIPGSLPPDLNITIADVGPTAAVTADNNDTNISELVLDDSAVIRVRLTNIPSAATNAVINFSLTGATLDTDYTVTLAGSSMSANSVTITETDIDGDEQGVPQGGAAGQAEATLTFLARGDSEAENETIQLTINSVTFAGASEGDITNPSNIAGSSQSIAIADRPTNVIAIISVREKSITEEDDLSEMLDFRITFLNIASLTGTGIVNYEFNDGFSPAATVGDCNAGAYCAFSRIFGTLAGLMDQSGDLMFAASSINDGVAEIGFSILPRTDGNTRDETVELTITSITVPQNGAETLIFNLTNNNLVDSNGVSTNTAVITINDNDDALLLRIRAFLEGALQ